MINEKNHVEACARSLKDLSIPGVIVAHLIATLYLQRIGKK